MLVVVISVVFAVVAPIVLIPCAVFCFLSRIVWTHQFLYVYESAFETGGESPVSFMYAPAVLRRCTKIFCSSHYLGLFWPKIFRRFVFGLIIAQATITGQFILKDARREAYCTIALSFLTYFFLRSTRARYDATSSFLPLEVATVMDISLDQDEELRKQRRHEKITKQQQQSPEISGLQSPLSEDDESLGGRIGEIDPFELAYVQPVIRASPHARPEQPFPPAQLGREAMLLSNTLGSAAGSTVGVIGEDEVYDDTATVRVQHHNQNDRRMLNQWWKGRMERHDNNRLFHILIGEECGTMTCEDQVHKPVSRYSV
jgi:hypothetical protein